MAGDLLQSEDDLAEDVAVDQGREGVPGLGQRQGAVDDRPDPGLLQERGQPGQLDRKSVV